MIKTGRQIVQKQQTENPKAMDEQLTALKLLYNDLGAQVGTANIRGLQVTLDIKKGHTFLFFKVTEGKQDLEKALSLSQKFQKETNMLQDWLITSEAQLQQKNSCGDMPADIDAEIAWANVSLLFKPFHPCVLKPSRKSAYVGGQQGEQWYSLTKVLKIQLNVLGSHLCLETLI